MNQAIKYTTVAAWSLSIANALHAMDFDPNEIFKNAGISLADIQDDPYSLLDIKQMTALWKEVALITQMPNFGLIVGEHSNIKKNHVYNHLIKKSDSLLQVLEGLPSYYGKLSNSVCLTLNNTPHLLGVKISPLEGVEISDMAIDAFFSSFVNIINDFVDSDSFIHHVDLVRHKPKSIRPWLETFCCETKFDQEVNCLWLNKSVLTQFSVKNLMHEKRRVEPFNLDKMSLTEKIERLIHSSIANNEPTLDEIAVMLNMSVRSISRSLKEEGLTFRDILKQKRQELALHYLTKTDESILIISENLGYKNMGNFTRAFQVWFGKTPSQYRDEHKNK
ncbi:AraC family transcriptional regulator ligand-binding domain-containing protein [Moritella sp. 24]|uniref:AraC family transcriptional regulator n=1 Tax=Moritella sp. 24 TaxID=2746230 RepID=UPI001BADCE71|nr:AraC family transcriptional regulator [Moritella sp. 24]QUM77220.1 AraC family transcriptional regulator ligand-binding domain-containing protein [Moritella sp. 24]